MPDWTLSEFLFELELDSSRKALFVEGSRDLAFWQGLVPSPDRGDTTIYPISVIKCEFADGGERGRLLCIARAVLNNESSLRVLFFADADCDRILGHKEPSNVVLTDGRDLESYGLTQGCLTNLCIRGIGMNEVTAEPVLNHVIEVTRPIGILRIASQRVDLKLPFQRTFEKRGLSKFLCGTKVSAHIDINKLISTLLQNAGISLVKTKEIVELFDREKETLSNIGHDQIVHGKDFKRALAFFFGLDEEQIDRLLFLSMNLPEIALRPNIAHVRGWFTA